MSPWSGRVHNAHQSQPCLSFERLTSTLFEMRNSVSIKIGKKQSINQSIKSESSHQSLGFWSSLYIVVVCLIPRSAINHVAACKQLSAMSWRRPHNPMQWHWPFTWHWYRVQDFAPPAIFALLVTHHGYQKRQKAEPATAEGWRPQWSIERLQSRSNATLPPIASWMRQFASFFCLLWLRCTIEIDDGSRKWKERSKYGLED